MKMYSAQDSGDLSRMLQCREMGVRMRHGFSVQLSVGSISPSWLQYYQYLGHLPHISEIHGVNRRVRFGPKYVTLWTFSGAWPLISATDICNWRESRRARVLKLRPRKGERELKAFHPFYWQWVKENSLEIFVRRGTQEVTVTWKVYG